MLKNIANQHYRMLEEALISHFNHSKICWPNFSNNGARKGKLIRKPVPRG